MSTTVLYSPDLDKLTLYDEYRLIERGESEINGAWKGAHLLLFFLAFVFGSFCTFCFHMLMYLFDEKCVLFPKLLSLTSLRHNVIYEFIPEDKEKADMLPVDFLSTQWMEKSACYLPTYVPLISAIFGLVWTTMFLMCSTGSRTLTGLQRPWRVIQPVFVFSLAMGCLCIYTSVMTQYGLNELCLKLGEITGSSTCSYTVNVATLAYERQIRGVYQATRLTILSAWLHTACWLLSALLALLRVCLAVDFQLVHISVDLVGNIDRMLERHEKQIRTVSPNMCSDGDSMTNTHRRSETESLRVHFHNKSFNANAEKKNQTEMEKLDMLYLSENSHNTSELSLVPEERNKLSRLSAYQKVPKENQFIVKMVYDFMDEIQLPETPTSPSLLLGSSSVLLIARQFGQSNISKAPMGLINQEGESNTKPIIRQSYLQRSATPSPSRKKDPLDREPKSDITTEIRKSIEDSFNKMLESANLAIELESITQARKKMKDKKVVISESVKSTFISDDEETIKDTNTQTKPKEKQE